MNRKRLEDVLVEIGRYRIGVIRVIEDEDNAAVAKEIGNDRRIGFLAEARD